ncbi:hypothetical protein [Ruminococcus sp. JL13D9]|uniref:hypothetical protein n=1 Tax=Ruminococcus sp. JL13D9 TaxID=3233381 RepID=UPI00389B036C
MKILNRIIQKMNNSNQKNKKLETVFNDENNDYYGDLLTAIVKAQRLKLNDVALDAKMDPRVFQNVRSKTAKDRRTITRFEALRVAVVLNLPPRYTKLLLERMNVALPLYTNSDMALAAVIYTNHNTSEEFEIRLKCLEIIEKNALDFSCDFENEFKKINLEDK